MNIRLIATGLLVAGLIGGAGCRHSADQPATTAGTDQGIQAALSTNVVHIGDLLHLSLTIPHSTNAVPQPPDLSRGKEIVVRDMKSSTLRAAGDQAITRFDYALTSFVITNLVVSTNAIRFLRSDGTFHEQPFPWLTIEVASVLKTANEPLRDIKGLARWPGVMPRWIWGLFIVVVLAIVASLIIRWFMTKPRTFLSYPPPPPPHERALKALGLLKEKGLIEKGLVEPFYIELSSIIRRYIEERFGLKAPEQTTEEFIREATGSRLLTMDHQALVQGFLEQCDLVKFARHSPRSEDMLAAFASAERLVRETIPVPPQPQEGAS